MPYLQFKEIFVNKSKEIKSKQQMEIEFAQRLRETQEGKVNMIVIGGLPGSGKTKLAHYMVRLLAQENV
jgi:adenylylsulfate kinase-like enzyme